MLDASISLLDDPIVALATPPGRSALALIRLSGSASDIDGILSKTVVLKSHKESKSQAFRRFSLVHPESSELIDEGLIVRFRAPRSYTGEDVVEFSIHGNPVLVELALDALQRAGARAAGPGEFTRRAVVSGKLNLIEAEAVAATIEATSAQAARLVRRHLGGELGARIEVWRGKLLGAAALLEGLIDFPEEMEDEDLSDDLELITACRNDMDLLVGTFERGRSIVQGFKVVLTGPVNAGKSTLFNRLVGFERAIVSDQEGTTRDVVSEALHWDGFAVRLEDTAGLRKTVDPVEKAGIERSSRAQESADLVIRVANAENLVARAHQHDSAPDMPRELRIATHTDRIGSADRDHLTADGWLCIGLDSDEGLVRLRERSLEILRGNDQGDALLIHTSRQRRALERSLDHCDQAMDFGIGEPALAAVELRQAVRALEEFLGEWNSEDVLDELFERFCIGK